jgi:hypothetical protein
MRTVIISTAALALGFVLSAAAQNVGTQSGGCGSSAMSAKTSQGVSQGGFSNVQDVPKAVVVHAMDPDGNPVIMVLAPAQ